MPPADQVLVFARPRGFLVLRVADDSGGAEFANGEILHRAGLRGNQYDFSFYLFTGVVALLRAVTDVDQIRGDIGALAVFGQHDRLGVVAVDFDRCNPRVTCSSSGSFFISHNSANSASQGGRERCVP